MKKIFNFCQRILLTPTYTLFLEHTDMCFSGNASCFDVDQTLLVFITEVLITQELVVGVLLLCETPLKHTACQVISFGAVCFWLLGLEFQDYFNNTNSFKSPWKFQGPFSQTQVCRMIKMEWNAASPDQSRVRMLPSDRHSYGKSRTGINCSNLSDKIATRATWCVFLCLMLLSVCVCVCVCSQINTGEVEALLSRLPCTFRQELTGVGASLEKRWSFCGFQGIKST